MEHDNGTGSPVPAYLLDKHGHVLTHDQVWGEPSQRDPLAPVLRKVWPLAQRRLDRQAGVRALDDEIHLLDEVIGELLDGVAAARARLNPAPLPAAMTKPAWPKGLPGPDDGEDGEGAAGR